jgi:predicted aconitase
MKLTLKKASIAGMLSLAALGATSAFAMGGMNNATPDEIANRQTSMFTEQASMLGVSVDDVKNAWAEGKNFETLATEKGVTKAQLEAKMKAKRDEMMKTQLATLVSKGVITQAQADKRLATMSAQTASGKSSKHGRHGGMMGGFGF